MADEIDASDFSIEKLEQLEAGGKDASAEAKKQADAFEKYLTETCGNPLDNLDMPEMPESGLVRPGVLDRLVRSPTPSGSGE